ncbi:MAG TPA: hypothetical protein PLH57_01780 [Oligoflexia bacterium]|mgnify:FL=1|nr:hypothetical protein [Oligoflexia bacterium]
MLTTDNLGPYCHAWAENFQKEHQASLSQIETLSPIAWYQGLYQFFHDLKNSLLMSPENELKELLPAVEVCNALFSSLAEGKLDLAISDKKILRSVLERPDFSLEDIKTTVEEVASNAVALKNLAIPFAKNFQWDSFATARAQSALRYGYRIFERTDVVSLSKLENHDKMIDLYLKNLGGFSIVRKMEPKTIGGTVKNKIDDMRLECIQLAAVPGAAQPSAPWRAI